MSVNPGFGGQSFIENTYYKVKDLRVLANTKNIELLIKIDGGVSNKNAKALTEAGANILVSGNYFFGNTNPK